LGGCFGPSCRVAFGHDFVGDSYDGTNANTEGPDPRDNCNGHGTHVAGKLSACLRYDFDVRFILIEKCSGIIGARDPQSGFVGVAPEGKNH
jgi:subtilisin family serine protease